MKCCKTAKRRGSVSWFLEEFVPRQCWACQGTFSSRIHSFRKAIPIADSEAVLKIAFPLPSFSSSVFHVIPHMGKQITAATTSCVPLTSANTVGSLGELLAQVTSLSHPVERKMWLWLKDEIVILPHYTILIKSVISTLLQGKISKSSILAGFSNLWSNYWIFLPWWEIYIA